MPNQTHYKINGMKCQGCVTAVKETLTKLPGFVEAEVDLQAATAVVTGTVDPEAAVKALADIGYPASVQDG